MGLQFSVERLEPDTFKVAAIEGGVNVSWLYVIDVLLHYGSAKVRVGGVAGVYTPREYRGRGFSAATLRYAVEWMKGQGYPLTALFGIHEYYHKFGYATFMGEHTVTMSLRDSSRVESEDLDWEISDDSGYFKEEIAGIYETTNALWVGARARDPSTWPGFRKGVSWEHPAKPLVLKSSGRVVAYAALERWPSPEELLVAEVGAKGHSVELYRSLLKVLYKLALEERKSHIKVHAPPDHPFTRLARVYGCTVESFYPWSGGGMARVIRLRELLEAIKPELELRSRDLEGCVTIRTGGEEVTLRCRRGDVDIEEGGSSTNIVELDPGEAAQLVLGYSDFVRMQSRSKAQGSLKILSTLFPSGEPYVWQPDRW